MTKEQLRAYRDIKLERDKLKGMIEELEVVLYGPRSQKLDGMPRGGAVDDSRVEDVIIKRSEVLETYKAKEAELALAMLEIEQAIETLEPRERTLIRLYYAEGLTWEEVCVAMNYSWRQIHRIHGAALEALKTKRKEETNA